VVERGRSDDWYWLRDRADPETTAHLTAENAYTAAATAHTGELRRRLYEEIVARIEETDESAPVPWEGHWYYHRTVADLQYPIHCRRTGSPDAPVRWIDPIPPRQQGGRHLPLGGAAHHHSRLHRIHRLHVDAGGVTEGRSLGGESLEVPVEEQLIVDQRVADQHRAVAATDGGHPDGGPVHRLVRRLSLPQEPLPVEPGYRRGLGRGILPLYGAAAVGGCHERRRMSLTKSSGSHLLFHRT
jgi:hypothetical protein